MNLFECFRRERITNEHEPQDQLLGYCSKMGSEVWKPLICCKCAVSKPPIPFWSSGSRTCRLGSLLERNERGDTRRFSHIGETTDAHGSPAKVESPGSRGVLSLSLFPRSRASSECISKKKLSTHHSQSSCPPSRKSRFLAFGRSCALKARRASFSRRAGEHTSSFAPRQCRHADVFRLEQLVETGRLVVDA